MARGVREGEKSSVRMGMGSQGKRGAQCLHSSKGQGTPVPQFVHLL